MYCIYRHVVNTESAIVTYALTSEIYDTSCSAVVSTGRPQLGLLHGAESVELVLSTAPGRTTGNYSGRRREVENYQALTAADNGTDDWPEQYEDG